MLLFFSCKIRVYQILFVGCDVYKWALVQEKNKLGSFLIMHKNRDFPNEFRGKFQTFLFLDCAYCGEWYLLLMLKMFQISIMASLLVVLYIWFPEFLEHVSCVLVYMLNDTFRCWWWNKWFPLVSNVHQGFIPCIELVWTNKWDPRSHNVRVWIHRLASHNVQRLIVLG